MRQPMSDLVVLVPGFLGSELWKGDQMLWGFPGGLRDLFRFRSGLGRAIDDLKLDAGDSTRADGSSLVEARRLLSVPQVIAGFIKCDGYDTLRNYLFERFQLYPTAEEPTNYIDFPYDWRQTNRVSAKKLETEVAHRLEKWRTDTGNPDAKVIYICHSMGGLVARYFLEVLGGWKSCRALITLGTPHRGAVNALDSLVNGYLLAGVDLTDALRSYPAAYELLPIYKMIDDGKPEDFRVVELALNGVNQQMAADARAFHLEIQEHVKRRPARGYSIYYFAGVDQPTSQSARLEDGKLEPLEDVPADWASYLETGDGTVPYVSTIPVELSDDPLGAFTVPALHAMLQSNDDVLRQISAILNRLQDSSLGGIRGIGKHTQAQIPAIQLILRDLYLDTTPVTIRARVIRGAMLPPQQLHVEITSAVSDFRLASPMVTDGEEWTATILDLPDGLYYARVAPRYPKPGSPLAVEDVFEVYRSNIV